MSRPKHGFALGGGGAYDCELLAPREGGPADGFWRGGLLEEDELDELVLAPIGCASNLPVWNFLSAASFTPAPQLVFGSLSNAATDFVL